MRFPRCDTNILLPIPSSVQSRLVISPRCLFFSSASSLPGVFCLKHLPQVQCFASVSSLLLMLIAICNLAVSVAVTFAGQLSDSNIVAAFDSIVLALLVLPAATVAVAHVAAIPRAARSAFVWVRARWVALPLRGVRFSGKESESLGVPLLESVK